MSSVGIGFPGFGLKKNIKDTTIIKTITEMTLCFLPKRALF